MLPKNEPKERRARDRAGYSGEHRCVLVTGAGGCDGRTLAEQLLARGLEVHCADSRPMHVPSVPCHMLPAATDPGYLPALARLVQRYAVDLVLPVSSPAVPVISVGRLAIGADVVVPGPGPTAMAHDRLLTAWSLWSHGVAVPDFGVPSDFVDIDAALEVMGGLLTLRSRWASSGRAASVLSAADELDWSAMSDDWIVQQFVPGRAYCVVVYRPLDGRGRLSTVLEESFQNDGTITVEPVTDTSGVMEVERVAQAAVRAMGLTGPVEVGIRCRADGTPVVLDVTACFGPHSDQAPEMLDAVLRDHPSQTPVALGRAGGEVASAGGFQTPRGQASRKGALR